MGPPFWSALLWLGVAGATLAWSAATNATRSPSTSISGGFIIECESNQKCELVAKATVECGGTVRFTFKSDDFIGISGRLHNSTTKEDKEAFLSQFDGIKNKWMNLRAYQIPEIKAEEPWHVKPKRVVQADKGKRDKLEKSSVMVLNSREHQGFHIRRAKNDKRFERQWHHLITHVDKLHKEGFTGSGIKIAVIDSGVDYHLPALGGCFGRDCRVTVSEDFINDGPPDEPDCLIHGTAVASVLASNSRVAGYTGVAPNATIMSYRVVNCGGYATNDQMIAGWIRAKEDGAQIIVSSAGFVQGWAQSPEALVVARIVVSGVPCIVAHGNDRSKGLFHGRSPGSGRGVTSVGAFAFRETKVRRNGVRPVVVTGSDVGRAMTRALSSSKPVTVRARGLGQSEAGRIAGFLSYGPTWDLDIKPNVGSPGQSIPVLQPGEIYSYASGTSFAAPFLAGVFALVAEARGTFNPVTLNSLIMSTAEPQTTENGYFVSVAQQGGGLVKAWEAAHATTLVEPAALAFNDTDNRVSPISLRITNTAKAEVTYRLSNLAATTLYTFRGGSSLNPLSSDAADAQADIKLSQSSITIGAGQSATLDVSAADPKGLDAARLDLWSGWISIRGSDGTNLTVPYLGLGGSLRSAEVLASYARDASANNAAFILPRPPNGQTPSLYNQTTHPQGAVRVSAVTVHLGLVLGSPYLRVDVVPVDICSASPLIGRKGASTTTISDLSRACVRESIVTEFAGVKSIGQLPGYPQNYAMPGEVNLHWSGFLASGRYAPPGRYRIVARALSIMGDAANWTHWQTVRSPIFSISYDDNLFLTGDQPSEGEPSDPLYMGY
ncbi:hypothetical protein QQS21_010301 [Conoideocrella luteorostrata]|uniref:Uncharacterized protein n=1 Tax=Conoideocrella luteorostrata TaxID=1105319 RepID=A0AAJ0CFA7_9HYPO|nr:hypothetical protein QQS21_010301 [Conoideocrella luteorostrata]